MRRHLWIWLAVTLLVTATIASAPADVRAATLTVNSTADTSDANAGDGSCDDGTGACTLRAAIEEASALAGSDIITFNIAPGGPQTIVLNSALPAIYGGTSSDTLTIDGSSQPGIEIDGSTPATEIISATSMAGLTLKNFKISNATDKAVKLNQVDNGLVDGLDVSGAAGTLSGIGIYAWSSIDNLTIQNVTANNRNQGIFVGRGSNLKLLDNNLRDNNTGFQITDITAIAPNGLVEIRGNDYSDNYFAMDFHNMSDLVFADSSGTVPGANVILDAAVDGLPSVSGSVISLNNVSNTLIDGVDLSGSAGSTDGNGIQANGISGLTVQNSTITNRYFAVYAWGDETVKILNNDLSSTQAAISLTQILDTIEVTGNNFSSSKDPLKFLNTSDLVISDGSAPGTNVTLTAADGLGSVDGTVLSLSNIANIDIKNVDLSYTAGPLVGNALRIFNSGNLVIENVSTSNRGTGIYLSGTTNAQLTNNDLSDSSQGLVVNGAAGTNVISGNDFSSNSSAILLANMSNQVVSEGAAAGTTISITPDNTFDGVTAYLLSLSQIENSTVTNLDLSQPAGSSSGTGIYAYLVNDLTIENNTLSNRFVGISAYSGSDLRVLNNSFSGSSYGMSVGAMTENVLPGGVQVSCNDFSQTTNAINLSAMSDLVISDGTAAGTNVALGAGSGLTSVTDKVISLSNINNAHIESLDLSKAAGPQEGTGLELGIVNATTIEKVTVANRTRGIDLANGNNIVITCSVLQQNQNGILALDFATNVTIQDNHFEGNLIALNAGSASKLADNNYWGAADGPLNLGGSGDEYRGNVDADPFLASSPSCAGLVSSSPPTAVAGGPYTVAEGGSVQLDGSASNDPDQDDTTLTFAWDLDNNGSYETPGVDPTFSAAGLDGPGSATVGLQVTDNDGLLDTAVATVNISNALPQVDTPVVINSPAYEGDEVAASATFSDAAPDDSPFTCTIDYGDGDGPEAGTVSGSICSGPAHSYADDGSYPVTVTVTDKDGGSSSSSMDLSVENVSPTIDSIVTPVGPVHISDQPVAVEVSFSDPGADTHDLSWNWGDSTPPDNQLAASSPATKDHTYSEGGIYTIVVTVTDDNGSQATQQITIEIITDAPSPQQLIDALDNEIRELYAQGEIRFSYAYFLIVTLERAERRYNLGYKRLAVRDLRIFIGLVNYYEYRGLNAEVAGSLRTQAAAIIEAIESE